MPVSLIEFTPASIAGGVATGTISTTKSCTAGSAVVAFHFNGEWASPPTPACAVAGVAATLAESAFRGSGYPYERCFFGQNTAGGSTTVTVNGFASGRACTLVAYELLGVPTSAVKDASASHTAVSASTTYYGAPSGGINIAAGSLAIAAIYVDGESSITAPSGWALLTAPTMQDGKYTAIAYKLFASGASGERAAFGGTLNGAAYEGFIIAIKAAALPVEISGTATLDDVTASGNLSSLAPSTLSGTATLDDVAASGTLGVAPGTLTSSGLVFNNDSPHSGQPFEAFVSSKVTGVLVLRKTGLTSSSPTPPTKPTCSFSDPLVLTGQQYRVTWRNTATGEEGTELLIAS